MSPQAPGSAGPVPAADRSRICFRLTEDDLRTLYGEYYRHTYRTEQSLVSSRRRLKLVAAAAGLLLALLALLVLRERDVYSPPQLLLWTLLIATFGVLVSLADDRPRRRASASRALEAAVRSQQVEGLLGEWVVEIQPEGVWADCPAQAKLVRWSGIGDVQDSGGFVRIQERLGGGICIPTRAFPGPEAACQFMDRLNAELAARSEGFAQRVFAHLARIDFPCPGCRYNLRGVKELRCPECGRAIRWDDVPEAFRRSDAV